MAAFVTGFSLVLLSCAFVTHALVRRHQAVPRLLYVNEFPGPLLDLGPWQTNTRALGNTNQGRRNGGIVLAGEEASLSAASTNDKDSAGLVTWMDSRINWRTSGPCRVEITLAGSVSQGGIAVSVSDGRPPPSYDSFGGTEILVVSSMYRGEAVLPTKTVWLDFLPDQRALLYRPETNDLDFFEVIDLRNESAWHLRFSCAATTSKGLIPGAAALSVKGFRVWSQARSNLLVGRVVEALSERPIAGALVRSDQGPERFRTASRGSFAFPLTRATRGFQIEKEGYASWKTTGTDSSAAVLAALRILKPKFGTVVETYPCPKDATAGIGVMDGTLMTFEVFNSDYSRLVPLLPAAPGLPGESRMKVFNVALNSFNGDSLRSIGITHFDGKQGGRILDLRNRACETIATLYYTTNGTQVPLNWPRGCVLDGSLVWFLERDIYTNRHAIRAFDLDQHALVHTLSTDDDQMLSLAYDGERFWISSESGQVYSVSLKDPIAQGSVEGNRGRSFDGFYSSLAYHDGFLWGFQPKRRVVCKIKITD